MSKTNKQAKTIRNKGRGNLIIIFGDFNMTLSIMDRTTREKINKETRRFEQHFKPTRPKRHL